LIEAVLVVSCFPLNIFELGCEAFELEGLVRGLVNFEPEDVIEPFNFFNGVIQFGLGFRIPLVELGDGLLVGAKLLLDLELIGVVKALLQVAVFLPQ
jgi:hypothetical protein